MQGRLGIICMLLSLQANEADRKEDREIICAEVFTDLTGALDDTSKGDGCQRGH